jgi:ribonuclease P protein component
VSVPQPVGRFSAAQRVRKRSEFQEIQQRGRRLSTSHFVLVLYARADGDDPARLGITASKKIGNAVTRARAKRLVREAFRATRDLWPPGIDVVVIAKRPPTELKLADVVDQWRARSHTIRARALDARQDQEKRRQSMAAGAKPTQTPGA